MKMPKLGWCTLLHQPWGRDAPLLQIGLRLRYTVCSGPDLRHRTSRGSLLCTRVRWHWGGGSPHVLKILAARHTSGVSRVDNAENTRAAVLPGFCHGSLELCNIQTPAVVLIQVVIDLHGPQVSQGGRVQRVLGDGDQDSCSGTALARHQQLQHGLEQGHKRSVFIRKHRQYHGLHYQCVFRLLWWLVAKLSTEVLAVFWKWSTSHTTMASLAPVERYMLSGLEAMPPSLLSM